MLTHSEMNELYELYAMEALEPEIAAEIEGHLAEGCEYCRDQISEARTLVAGLALTAPQVRPSAALRNRVLLSLSSERATGPASAASDAPRTTAPRTSVWWLLSAACAALFVGCIWLGYQNGEMRSRVDAVQKERNQLEQALKTLSRSETRTVQFGRTDQPHGRVFVNRGTGVVFIASRLPKLSGNRTFQLWLIPPSGAPKSAGLFRADANDESLTVSTDAVETGTKAVAVSVEPEGGSPAPTTTPIIVVPIAE